MSFLSDLLKNAGHTAESVVNSLPASVLGHFLGSGVTNPLESVTAPKTTKGKAAKTPAASSSSSSATTPRSDSALLNLLQQSGLYDTGQAKQQDWIAHHPLASVYAQQHGINLLNPNGAGAGNDPLSQQLFFFSTIAPYLNQIKSQTESLTGPLYAKAASQLSHLPSQYQSLAPFLSMMQAGDSNLQTALAGSAAVAPSLDALMGNVSAERAAQQKAYYESLLAKSGGGTAAGNPFGLTLPNT